LNFGNTLKKSSGIKRLFFRQEDFIPMKMMRNWAIKLGGGGFIQGKGRPARAALGFYSKSSGELFYPS
jgi:hypothetical protein